MAKGLAHRPLAETVRGTLAFDVGSQLHVQGSASVDGEVLVTGQAEEIGQFDNKGTREFNPPTPGEMLDWVLVLDDAEKKYPAPGSKAL